MPPRQRPAANIDDSRSEASSGPGGKQGGAGKGRRAGQTSAAAQAALNKDPKAPIAPPEVEEVEERPQVRVILLHGKQGPFQTQYKDIANILLSCV